MPPPDLTPEPPPERPSSWIEELRRRRVFRVAGAYVLVAWILMQAGEIVFPAFELPNRALRSLILALAAGLPLVIVLAWLLDVSSSGIRLSRRRSKESPAEIGQSLEMLLLGVLVPVFAFGILLAVLKFRSDGSDSPSHEPSPAAATPSIAVLPFEELSLGETDNGFFARGMHEDILIHLARIDGLKVISRTSVMPYANRHENVRTIGAELGVAHVLEGSVRRADGEVRVTAQLIEVATDDHVWAENFDARLEDVLEVQTRIARAIAGALASELAAMPPEIERVASPRVLPAAYDAYLKARDLHRNLDAADRESRERARHLYELAVQSDETLAVAWLQLGILHAQAAWFEGDRSAERAALARGALERARRQGVDSDQLAIAEGILAYYVEEDPSRALLQFSEAADRAPANSEAHFYRAMLLRRAGRLEEALEAQRRALELDPLNASFREEFALTLALAGRLDEARRENIDLLRRHPSRLRARYQKWQLDLELDGDPDTLLDEILADDRERWRDQHYVMLETVSVLTGRADAAIEILTAQPDLGPDTGYRDYRIGVLEGFAGRPQAKRLRLESAAARYAEFLSRWPDALTTGDRNRIEASFAAEAGDWDRALMLQARNVEAVPIERDLIVGSPTLWRLLHFQLAAARVEAALETLERLEATVALGAVLFGGHYVLTHWPEFEAARRDPRIHERLARIRPAYADRWARRPGAHGSENLTIP